MGDTINTISSSEPANRLDALTECNDSVIGMKRCERCRTWYSIKYLRYNRCPECWILANNKTKEAKEQNKRPDDSIEAQIKAIDGYQKKKDGVVSGRFKCEDHATKINRSLTEIRNHLDQIFSHGTGFVPRFEPVPQDIQAGHSERFGEKCLDSNRQIDQARSAIAKCLEDLNHEIELHKRTIRHQEHMSTTRDHTVRSNDASRQEEKIDQRDSETESVDTLTAVQDYGEECTTLEEDAPCVGRGERSNKQLLELPGVDQVDDREDTDTEEIASEEIRSFTQCQAQKPD